MDNEPSRAVEQPSVVQAFADLKASEERLRTIVNAIPIIAWYTRPDGAGEFWNKRWHDYTGLSPEGALGWGWQAVIHADDIASLTDIWVADLAAGRPGEVQGRLRRFDGEYRWFLFRYEPFRDESGAILNWYGTNIDIEDRKRAEDLLAAEKRLLEMVARGQPMSDVLDTLCHLVEDTASGCYCSIVLVDPSGTHLEHGAAPSLPASFIASIIGRPVNVESGPCAMAACLNQQVISTDLASETRWAAYEWCHMALTHGLRACWSTPITSTAGKVLGAFALYYDDPRAPTPVQETLIEQFTHIASIAVERVQSDAALKGSEARKAAILDSALDCIVGIDHDGCITEFNPAAERTFGYRRDQVVGKLMTDIIIPESLRKAHRESFARYLATGEPRLLGRRVEMTAVRADGSEFPVEVAISRISLDGPPSFTGYLRDITERKRSEDSFRAIVETTPECVKVIARDGTLLLVNAAGVTMSGAGSAAGVLGANFYDFVVPEDRARYREFNETVCAGHKGFLEFDIVGLQGDRHHMETHAAPIRHSDGSIAQLGITRDITARKQAEHQLRRSEAFLAQGQRLSLTGSFSWRLDTDTITCSEELHRVFEFEPGASVTLERFEARVHSDDISLFADQVARARNGSGDLDYELRLRMPDGRVKYLRTVAHQVPRDSGRLEYFGAVQDVTERRLSEETLARVRSELARVTRITSLGALTASIAHEVNQPLSGIVTNASTCVRMLASDPPNIDGARETARRTIRDGNRASAVITRLRALFSNTNVVTDTVDLNEATQEVLALSASELQRNRMILRVELADDLPPVTGDRVQLQQVIMNLLLNASDAMSAVGDRPRQLSIRTEHEEGDRVRLSVQDTGIGLDAEAMERVFEAFYTTKSSGMGIGLAVSRSIIDSHDGRLWAAPNEGPGATFHFSIPRRSKDAVAVDGVPAIPTPAVPDAAHVMRNTQ